MDSLTLMVRAPLALLERRLWWIASDFWIKGFRKLVNKRSQNHDAKKFEIYFASNDGIGSVEFYLNTELFFVEWKVSKIALDYDIPQMTRTWVL